MGITISLVKAFSMIVIPGKQQSFKLTANVCLYTVELLF